MGFVKDAKKNYFADQKQQSPSKIKSDKESQKEKCTKEIEEANQQIKVLESRKENIFS